VVAAVAARNLVVEARVRRVEERAKEKEAKEKGAKEKEAKEKEAKEKEAKEKEAKEKGAKEKEAKEKEAKVNKWHIMKHSGSLRKLIFCLLMCAEKSYCPRFHLSKISMLQSDAGALDVQYALYVYRRLVNRITVIVPA